MYRVSDPKTGGDIWVLPVGKDGKATPLLNTEFHEEQAQFSPDERWIAYTSDESSTRQVYVQPFPATGAKWQVSIHGGAQPRWRRDGRELFYIAPDLTLMSVEVSQAHEFETAPPKPLFKIRVGDLGTLGAQYCVSRDGTRFLINSPAQDPQSAPVTVSDSSARSVA